MRVRNMVLTGIAAAAVIGGAAGTALADQSSQARPARHDHTAKPRPTSPGEPQPTRSSAPRPTGPGQPRPTSSASPRPRPTEAPGHPAPRPSPIDRAPSYTG